MSGLVGEWMTKDRTKILETYPYFHENQKPNTISNEQCFKPDGIILDGKGPSDPFKVKQLRKWPMIRANGIL